MGKKRKSVKYQQQITKPGLQVIRQLLGLSPSSIHVHSPHTNNTVLIAIDAENFINYPRKREVNFEVGIAIIELPNLDKIKTYNFVAGSLSYYLKAESRFQFGKTVWIPKEDFGRHVMSCCSLENKNVILVGHDLANELKHLRRMGVSLPFVAALDTLEIARAALPNLRRYRLKLLLDHFDIRIHCPHCAGNDAHYTLILLLRLACGEQSDSMPGPWAALSASVDKLAASAWASDPGTFMKLHKHRVERQEAWAFLFPRLMEERPKRSSSSWQASEDTPCVCYEDKDGEATSYSCIYCM